MRVEARGVDSVVMIFLGVPATEGAGGAGAEGGGQVTGQTS